MPKLVHLYRYNINKMGTPQHIELLNSLAEKHKASDEEIDDLNYFEALENEAWMIVFNYCKESNYNTPENYLLTKPEFDEENSMNEINWLIDTLVVSHNDVAEIAYHLVSKFWPEQYTTIEDYVDSVRNFLSTPNIFYK